MTLNLKINNYCLQEEVKYELYDIEEALKCKDKANELFKNA